MLCQSCRFILIASAILLAGSSLIAQDLPKATLSYRPQQDRSSLKLTPSLTYQFDADVILSVTFSQSGTAFAVCGMSSSDKDQHGKPSEPRRYGQVALFNVGSPFPVYSIASTRFEPTSTAFSRNGGTLLTADGASVRKHHLNGTTVSLVAGLSAQTVSALPSYDDDLKSRNLFLANSSHELILFDLNGTVTAQTPTRKTIGGLQFAKPMSCNPIHKQIAIAGDSKGDMGCQVRLLDALTLSPLKSLVERAGECTAVAFSRDGMVLFAGTDGGELICWKLTDSRLLWRKKMSPDPIGQIECSTDGDYLLVSSGRNSLLIRSDTAQEEGAFFSDGACVSQFSPVGNQILISVCKPDVRSQVVQWSFDKR